MLLNHSVEPTVFDLDNSEHQHKVAAILTKLKISEELWEEIGNRLNGKPSTYLKIAIKEAYAEYDRFMREINANK